jgi:hypothetical protein
MFPDIAPVTVCVGVKLTYNAQTAELASSLLIFADREREMG